MKLAFTKSLVRADRHKDGFALDKATVKASVIAKVHTVHAVDAGLRD